MMISATFSRCVSSLHQFQDLRLDRDVQRGGRLVGDDQLGLAGQRDGDHDALAHAAGKLVRILLQPARRIGDADQAQQLDRALVRRGAIACRDAAPAVSVICRPIVSTGFSEVIGSWNTMPMSPPRISRIAASSTGPSGRGRRTASRPR